MDSGGTFLNIFVGDFVLILNGEPLVNLAVLISIVGGGGVCVFLK